MLSFNNISKIHAVTILNTNNKNHEVLSLNSLSVIRYLKLENKLTIKKCLTRRKTFSYAHILFIYQFKNMTV